MRIRKPTLSSIAAERLRRADPISFTSCGCTRRKLYAPMVSVIATRKSFASKSCPYDVCQRAERRSTCTHDAMKPLTTTTAAEPSANGEKEFTSEATDDH